MINHVITKKEPLIIENLEDDYYTLKWMDEKGTNNGTFYITKEFLIYRIKKINTKFKDCNVIIKPTTYHYFMMAYVIQRVKQERRIKDYRTSSRYCQAWDETKEEATRAYFNNLKSRNEKIRGKEITL